MNAEIISIGSELLLGQIVDTNASWIAQRLANNGINLFYKTTVGDNFERMCDVIHLALSRSDIVLTGGGIGPTKDDLTREAVAKVTNRNLITDKKSLLEIRERFHKRGLLLTKNNERQAEIPEGAIVIENPNGTAPAFIVEAEKGTIISLPGVPFEMKWLVDNRIIPYLKNKFNIEEIIHYRVLKVSDLGESAVDDKIGEIIAHSKNPTVGVLARPGQVDIRITAKAENRNKANSLIDAVDEKISNLLGDNIFGKNDDTIESIVNKLLLERNSSISIFENITAGTISKILKEMTGNIVVKSVVSDKKETISTLIKKSHLDIDIRQGESVATALATAVMTDSESTYGISVYGIEDSEKKSENLSSGNTWIAIVGPFGIKTRHIKLAGSGELDKQRTSMYTLNLLRKYLLEMNTKE
ncbi:MAG: CinA family nicotinamide mononucleotide deamidase-related protein [Dehalococcoidia bacterium]|nr:CinA family nicotinamide mononucleotide deamidase-related protein [Dehalococcoidia bacterium]